jgi:hypothetical protein
VRSHVRVSLLALCVGAITAVSASAAQGAVGIEKFVAVNCSVGHQACAEETLLGAYSQPKEVNKAEAEAEGYTQAGGHVPFGITDFKVTTTGSLPSSEVPTGIVKHIRTDVAPGLATSPSAVPQCTAAQFVTTEAVPGTGFYEESKCPGNTKIGENKATAYAGAAGDIPLEGSAYNLVQPTDKASSFGVALKLPKALTTAILTEALKGSDPAVETAQYFAHTLIEGSVEWGQEANGTNAGDYHDYFEIEVSTALPLISSRLVFEGRAGEGDFITNATSCPGDNTTRLALTGTENATVTKSFTSPVGLTNCNLVPFEPSFSLLPNTTDQDEADGISTKVALPRHPGATEVDSSQLKTAVFTLPQGMTLNPSAAAGLTDCTPAQARIHSSTAGVACPSTSALGTVSLEVPTLPPGSLKGNIYLGGPESGPITGPPYTMYLDAESARYGVSVRVKGTVTPTNRPVR